MSKQWNLNVQSQRLGKPREAAHVPGVAQQGQHVGSHAMREGDTGYRGEPLMAGKAFHSGVELGNAVAQSTQCGVGGSRKVMKPGQQGQH
jgi:hypothetical protein